MRNRRLGAALVLVAILSGCTAARLGQDQRDLRLEVIGLLDDQIMDNLIRAYNDDVMLHLDYTEFNGESFSSMEVSGYTGDNSELTLKNGSTDSAVSKGGSQISAKVAITGTLKIKAVPVSGKDVAKVYSAYKTFLSKAKVFTLYPAPTDPPEDAFKWRRGVIYNNTSKPEIMLFVIPNTQPARVAFAQLVFDSTLCRQVAPPKPQDTPPKPKEE